MFLLRWKRLLPCLSSALELRVLAFIVFLAILLPLSAVLSSPARALEVQGSLTDLADTTPGQDRWKASYQVSDWAGYGASDGFRIEIPRASGEYSQVENAVGGAEWVVVAIQVDPLIPA